MLSKVRQNIVGKNVNRTLDGQLFGHTARGEKPPPKIAAKLFSGPSAKF